MKKILIIIFILFTQLSYAIKFHVIISSEQAAPTPSFIVNESLLSPPPPSFTLSSFNSLTPTSVNYLIKIRAIGNLRTIIDNNPIWERAELQQYLSVVYDDSMDFAAMFI